MFTYIALIVGIVLIIFGVLYKYSLREKNSEFQKNRTNVPTDYDGMGTYSRYVNK